YDGWLRASADRLGMVWEPVRNQLGAIIDYQLKAHATFEVNPEDIYKDENGRLFCNEAAPIVRRMALFVQSPRDPANIAWNQNATRRVPTQIAPEMLFTHESPDMRYQIGNSDWSAFSTRVLVGEEDEVTSAFATYASTESAGLGMSPFGAF